MSEGERQSPPPAPGAAETNQIHRQPITPAEPLESTEPAFVSPAVIPTPQAASAPIELPEPSVEPATSAAAPSAPSTSDALAAAPNTAPAGPSSPPPRLTWLEKFAERPEVSLERSRRQLAAQSRRDFLLYSAGILVTAVGAWWLLPDDAKSRLLPGAARDRLDALATRIGLTDAGRERTLDRALKFDDDIAEALYSKDRSVRVYDRSQVTALRNNYDGQTPGPEYLATWSLEVSGLASGHVQHFTLRPLLEKLPLHEQVTRLVCVEGWSAVAWWGGIRFADFLAAYPPATGSRWVALRSAVNLDGAGRPDPYYVSIDLETARHPQTLLATHQGGQPLTVAHGAPVRLLVPMKLGLKNIKAVTQIAYSVSEPPDYWNERGYSRFDGL